MFSVCAFLSFSSFYFVFWGLLKKLGLQKTAFVQRAQEMKNKFWWNTCGKCPFKSNPFINPFVGHFGRLAWVATRAALHIAVSVCSLFVHSTTGVSASVQDF